MHLASSIQNLSFFLPLGSSNNVSPNGLALSTLGAFRKNINKGKCHLSRGKYIIKSARWNIIPITTWFLPAGIQQSFKSITINITSYQSKTQFF